MPGEFAPESDSRKPRGDAREACAQSQLQTGILRTLVDDSGTNQRLRQEYIGMGPLEGWKLADELNVYQIVLLITGNDPSDFEDYHVERWQDHVKRETIPYLTAIKNAARSGRLQFSEQSGYNGEGTDWNESLIGIESLRAWMREKNIIDGFFVSKALEEGRVADPTSGFYAPKLAAALRAWTEVTSDPRALNGRSPKKALEVWLRKHANEYGLTNKDGNPNALGIEEICKVANWKPNGGASPTAVVVPPTSPATPEAKPSPGLGRRVGTNPPYGRSSPMGGRLSDNLDEDIPF